MGFGDEIMALGRAEFHFLATGRPAAIADAAGNSRFHDLWKHNPAWHHAAVDKIIDGPNARPYIRHWEGKRAVYNLAHRPRAGRVHLTAAEEAFASDLDFRFAIVSPHVKGNASPNKDWGFERWAKAIEGFPLPVLQLGAPDEELLPGAIRFPTPTMRHAAAVVARAQIVLTNEGGLHHLAASMGRPAVVIHGGFTPPQVTGYKQHVNLADKKHTGCGSWHACTDCAMALAKITPAMVQEAARGVLCSRTKSRSS